MPANDTLILGAGLAGLYAAARLHAAGQRVRLIESRARPGGRILSVPAVPGFPHRLDLGPAWYWPDFNPRLQDLVAKLGLTRFVQHSRGVGLFEAQDGVLHRLPDGSAQQAESWRVGGGMASLIDALVAQLDSGSIQLASRATRLTLTDTGVAVRVACADGEHTLHAARVVSTLPPRLLAPLLADADGIAPASLAALRATPTWMAGQAKFVATYPAAFWRDAGFSGDAFSQRGPLGEIHDACDGDGENAALFGFVGVAAAQRQQLDPATLKNAALAQLVRLFGAAAATPQAVWLQDWVNEPDTATAADLAPVRAHPLAPAIALPPAWAARLVLAGTEFAGDTAGYLEGALESVDAALLRLQTAP